jgi:hypothetical protein
VDEFSQNTYSTNEQSATPVHPPSEQRFSEQLWIALAKRLSLPMEDEEFRCRLERCANDLRGHIKANCDSFPRQLKRNYHSLRMLIKGMNKLFAPQMISDTEIFAEASYRLIAAARGKVNLDCITKDLRILEDVCQDLENNAKLVGSPRGKRYEKTFLRRLTRLLDSQPSHLSGRQRANIAADLIRWAGGYPASSISIARYLRQIRGAPEMGPSRLVRSPCRPPPPNRRRAPR